MATPAPASPRPPDPTLVLLSPSTRDDSAPHPAVGGDDPLIGSVLKDTYTVLRKLGEGGMGAVYLAEHRSIRKKVAVKVLGGEFVHKAELSDRFLREARAAAMIESPNVIEIHDFGTTPDGAAFFVMEYLHGEDLGQLLHREGALPWARVRPILLQLCSALQAAHDRGIVHRDMKPENCFHLDRGDVIKVLDFGIAKVAADEADGGKSLTKTGMIFGTPEYMSPEQAQGLRHDHRVDIYATGVILFLMVTGELPFHADNFMGLLNKHMFEAPPRPSAVNPGANILPEVEAIILKALQKDPALRFQTMSEFAAAVLSVGSGAAPVAVVSERLPHRLQPGEAVSFRDPAARDEPVTATAPAPARRGWWAPIAVAVAAAAVTAAMLTRGGDPPAPISPVQVAVAAPANPELLPPTDIPRKQNPDLLPPTPPPPAPVVPPPVPTVSLQIRTGPVVATVLDPEGRELGSTAAPVLVPQGTAAVDLILRADGWQDLRVKVVPDRDQRLDRSTGWRRKPAGKPTRTGPKTPPPTKKPAGNSDLMPLGG